MTKESRWYDGKGWVGKKNGKAISCPLVYRCDSSAKCLTLLNHLK